MEVMATADTVVAVSVDMVLVSTFCQATNSTTKYIPLALLSIQQVHFLYALRLWTWSL